MCAMTRTSTPHDDQASPEYGSSVPDVALFPGPAQFSTLSHFSIVQATESWARPGNKAIPDAGSQSQKEQLSQ